MMETRQVTALLFGRGGSVALPGKNIQQVLGRPSLHYPLMAARESGIVGDIYLSTDSPRIQELARPFQVRLIKRPPELATNEALLEETIAHAFGQVQAEPAAAEFYLILLCNAVTVLPERIRQAHEMLLKQPELDSVTTVSRWNMFSPVRARRIDRKTERLGSFIPMETLEKTVPISCDRNKSEDCYFCDNSLTLVRAQALRQLPSHPGPFRWMGSRIGCIEQLPGGGDIDLAWQVPAAEWWLKQHGFTEQMLPWEAAAHDRA